VEVVPLQGALAVFADASRVPVGLTEEALALEAAGVLEGVLGRPVAVLYGFQIHGAVTYLYEPERQVLSSGTDNEDRSLTSVVRAPGATLVGRCDGLITGQEGVALQVRNADCLPVAIAGGGVVAMVHAGWRGLAADILGRVVKRIEGELGVAPQELSAAIGVGVGPCHYQVGAEVVEALDRHGVEQVNWRHGDRINLTAWAIARLVALGLPSSAIRSLGGCTACSRRHHSFRRDGTLAGRQWGAVVLNPRPA
jgi:YfiH family protein